MTAEEWALAASSFFAGLAAGFLGGLCTILRPMQAAMKGRDFRNFMETFLQYAANGLGKGFNYAWSGGTAVAAIVALVLLWDDPGSMSFVLTAQLDPIGDDLVGVRPLPGGSGLPLGGPAGRRKGSRAHRRPRRRGAR